MHGASALSYTLLRKLLRVSFFLLFVFRVYCIMCCESDGFHPHDKRDTLVPDQILVESRSCGARAQDPLTPTGYE